MTDFDTIRSALDTLAIFPLPDAVLFPGALLPLHVFEPRYREMTEDVLSGSKIMGVVRLRPGFEADYEGRPPVFETAGVGYVVGSERLPDGRYNILLRGVARARIEEELPPGRSYRTVRARLLLDTQTTRPDDVTATHAQIVAMCDRLAARLEEGGDGLRELVRSIPSPPRCVDVLAAAVVTDPDDRQRLLETLDPAVRQDLVLGQLAALVARFAPGSDTVN